jgi:hypothetical protein
VGHSPHDTRQADGRLFICGNLAGKKFRNGTEKGEILP